MAKDFAAVNRMELEAGLATVGNGKDELVSKFVKAWENQTARRALKGGTGISMALTLAACGGGSDLTVEDDNVIDVSPIASDLTANSETVRGEGGDDTIVAGLVQNPAGSDRVNSLQDEDVVDGGNGTDTFQITLGNPNDNGDIIIAPTILQVENIDVAFTAQVAMSLDLQDADDFLVSVDVTRIGSPQADDDYDTAAILVATSVINMPETAIDLSLADSVFYSDHVFGYRDDEIGGVEAVSIELASVNLETLSVGSTNNNTNHINTFDLTITEASHVETMNIRGGSAETAVQTVNIDAQANFILAADFGESEVLRFISGALQDSNGNGDYLDDNQAWSEFEHLAAVNVEGAGDVTLGAVGTAAGFTLDGSTATGDIHVNIANSVDDETASFTTGAGDDRITAISGRVAEADMASDLVTNAGADSVELDNTELHNSASISTGAGADSVAVEVLHGEAAGGATIDTGADDDMVSFTWESALWGANVGIPTVSNDANSVVEAVVEEEAVVNTGDGNDEVHFMISDNAGTPVAVRAVIEGDSADADGDDTLGGEVRLGAGNDSAMFSFTGTGLSNAGETAIVEGLLDGGEGLDDSMTVTGNKSLSVVFASSTPGGITGIETMNLVSTAGYDGARADAINDFSDEADTVGAGGARGDSLPDVVEANDDDGSTATYFANLFQVDSALQVVNITHLDGVVVNKGAEEEFQSAFDGDTAAYLIGGVDGETFNVKAYETTAVENTTTNLLNDVDSDGDVEDTAADDGAVVDPFGTIYDSGTFSADIDLVFLSGDEGVTSVDVNLLSSSSDAMADTLMANGNGAYDVAIVAANTFGTINLNANSDENLSIDLTNGFAAGLDFGNTSEADQAGLGWANIVNVNAVNVNTADYTGQVYVGYENATGVAHSVTTGSNDDIVRLGDDGAMLLGQSTVNMGQGDDILVLNGTGTTAGLTSADVLAGGEGDDVLAFGGTGANRLMHTGRDAETFGTKTSEPEVVRQDETEFTQVSGFETFHYGVGTATTVLAEPVDVGEDEVFGAFIQGLATDSPANSSAIVNDDNRPENYDVELNNDIIAANAAATVVGANTFYTLNVINDDTQTAGESDGAADFALNIMSLDRFHNVNYDGASGMDRVIFSEGSLEGSDVLDGGAGINDVIEVRNAATEITSDDLAGITNFEELELSSDAATDQLFTVILDDDAVHTGGNLTTIVMIGGGEGVYSYNSTFSGVSGAGNAQLDLDASALTVGITVDADLGGVVNDVIVTGAGADTIIGGGGADTLTGGTGADTFVFASGDTGIDAASADTITDFATGSDTLDVVTMNSVEIADGSGLADFAAFVTAAEASFVGTAADGYVAYDAAGTGNAWVAIDEDGDGAFDAGDTLIILEGINTATEILAADFS